MSGAKLRSASPITAAFHSNKEALRRFAARFVGNQDTEDLVQEVFVRAFRAEQGEGERIQQPRAYLFRVAKHVALNNQRSRSRRPTDYLEDYSEDIAFAESSNLEDEVMAEEVLGLHCAAIASLPEKCRKVWLLKKVYGMTHVEIAETLHISKKTIEGHLTRAFAHCDAFMERRRQADLSSTGQAARKATGTRP